MSGVSGRYVHYLSFLQDLEQLVMAAQVSSGHRGFHTTKAVCLVQ